MEIKKTNSKCICITKIKPNDRIILILWQIYEYIQFNSMLWLQTQLLSYSDTLTKTSGCNSWSWLFIICINFVLSSQRTLFRLMYQKYIYINNLCRQKYVYINNLFCKFQCGQFAPHTHFKTAELRNRWVLGY